MGTNLPADPPSEPGRHGIAVLLALLDGIRAVAFDRTLADDDIARRVRDLLREHEIGELGQ
jgi:hypothetical protein